MPRGERSARPGRRPRQDIDPVALQSYINRLIVDRFVYRVADYGYVLRQESSGGVRTFGRSFQSISTVSYHVEGTPEDERQIAYVCDCVNAEDNDAAQELSDRLDDAGSTIPVDSHK